MAYYEDIIYDKDQIKCSLCSMYIKDDDYLIESHIISENHRDLVVRRTLIRNGVEVINNNFYCNVCNKTMAKNELGDHLQCFNHKNELEKIKCIANSDGNFLIFPEDPNKQVNIHGVFINCILCDRQIEYTLESVKLHIALDKHRRARATAVQPLNGIFSVEGSTEDLYCKFCRVYFENYIETIFEHVDHNSDHLTKITKILNLIKDENITIEKFLMDPKEDKADCAKCKTMVACNVDNLQRHIKGKLHKTSQN